MSGVVQERERLTVMPGTGAAVIAVPEVRSVGPRAPRRVRTAEQVLDHRTATPRPWPQVVDVVVAAVALIVLSPVFLIVAAMVALTSSGPVLYRQRRYGQYGSTFGIVKFRTMHVDADKRLTELLAGDPAARAEYESSSKLRNDPRVTHIGRFLRRTSLDELPQLWNVIRGDMRLVGPRPLAHEFELRWYGERVIDLLSVKPGVTGPFQVFGRNDLSVQRRVELELEYVATSSAATDARYLVRTVGVLAKPLSNGAC